MSNDKPLESGPMTKEEARRRLKALQEADRANGPMSTHARQARAELKRAAMPPAERNDSDAGEGARRKMPMRCE